MGNILKHINDKTATLTINRPEALNAFNVEVIEELEFVIEEMIHDDKVGVIIITGAGEKSFIAGADIKAMQKMDQASALEFGKKGQLLTKMIENSPKPVIAAVNGFARYWYGGCWACIYRTWLIEWFYHSVGDLIFCWIG